MKPDWNRSNSSSNLSTRYSEFHTQKNMLVQYVAGGVSPIMIVEGINAPIRFPHQHCRLAPVQAHSPYKSLLGHQQVRSAAKQDRLTQASLPVATRAPSASTTYSLCLASAKGSQNKMTRHNRKSSIVPGQRADSFAQIGPVALLAVEAAIFPWFSADTGPV